MFPTTLHRPARRGFTLVEAMTASFLALFVIASAYGINMMAWRWWHEISPVIEAQRTARAAVTNIIMGMIDSTEGTDTIGSLSYLRRNGIAGALFDEDNVPPSTPVISADKTRIYFRSQIDAANVRSYYMGTDPSNGDNYVYYVNNASATKRIDVTRGITGLEFSYFVDSGSTTRYNIIQVKARVYKDVLGSRNEAYPIRVEYSDYTYLKNIL